MISALSFVNKIASPCLVNSRTEICVSVIVGVNTSGDTNGPAGVCVVTHPVCVIGERSPVAVCMNIFFLVLIM